LERPLSTVCGVPDERAKSRILVVDEDERLVGVIPRVTLLNALGAGTSPDLTTIPAGAPGVPGDTAGSGDDRVEVL